MYNPRRTLVLASLAVGALAVLIGGSFTQSSFAVPQGGTWVRADPENYQPGTTVDCVALTDIAEVDHVVCKLFDDSNCVVGQGVECASGTDNSATAPTLNDVPGSCGNAGTCEEYRVSFDPQNAGADVTPGKELHFRAYFYNAQNELISVESQSVQTHSFFVVPESPLGIAALIGSSLAALAGYSYFRSKKGSQIAGL